MDYVLIFFAGFLAFTVSTVAGGGGALLLVPITSFFLPVNAVPPVVQLGNFLGRPTRVMLFWKFIRWDIVKVYLPAAWVGAFLGAWLFVHLDLRWVQALIGIFLITTIFQYRFGQKSRSFPMQLWMFAPLGGLVCFVSSVIGATGAVLNPFYMNFGVSKEELVATKAVNSFLVAIVQLSTYGFFGVLTADLWPYGLCIGLGAAFGNVIGKRWLAHMSEERFKQWVIAMMVISGVVMLVKLYFGD